MRFNVYTNNLILRILLAFLLTIFRQIFNTIFAPLTMFWSFYLFNIFVPGSVLEGVKLITPTNTFSFIPACTAASAYLLLSLLILLTKDISWENRLKMFISGSLAILFFNLIRIEILLFFFYKLTNIYPLIHLFFWKFMSTLYVVFVWIILSKVYKVKSIPAYSDIKHLIRLIKK